jgi:hypothetical protein
LNFLKPDSGAQWLLLPQQQLNHGGNEMPKIHSGKKSLKLGRAGSPKTKIVILLVAIAVISITVFLTGTKSSNSVYASPINQKRYKATRPIVVDRQTGQRRVPNQQEVDEVVASLQVLANRPENLPQTSLAGGAVAIDLEGGFGGVMLARPNEDGTWETKCVFTFEEGAEFLGLVEDNSTE